MTLQITASSNTAATVSLTGTATAHLNANDAANLTITWLSAAFTAAPASNITNSNKTDFVINFADQPSIAYLGSGFTEAITNNGTVTDSILIQITDDTFQDTDADNILDIGSEVVLGNIPAGLTPSIALSGGDTIATLTLTGTATAHTNANDVADITFAFQNGAFTNSPTAADVTGATGPASSGLGVNFRDITLTYSVDTFAEAIALDGSIGNTITVTLAGDTFTASTGTFTQGNQYTVANVPANLTVVVTLTSSTTATISLTGTATNHLNANDIANL